MNRKRFSAKPRLLIILNRFVIGGPAADTIPLAWHLKDDFEISILCGEKEKDEVEPTFLLQKHEGILLKKIKYLKRSINPFTDALAFFKILSVIRKFKPDIIHTHGSKSGFLGRLAASLSAVPVIIHTFHGHFFHSYFSKSISGFIAIIERAVGKITTCAIVLSTSQKDELINGYKIFPSSKVAVIPLGFSFVDEGNSSSLRESFRKKYNVKEDDIAIGIIGRIANVKNHAFFVKVIEHILSGCRSHPPAFFIIGDGDLRHQVEDELRQKKVLFSDTEISAEARVVFTSWLTNIGEVMNGLDIVVLTSLNEGTPLSIIEAQFFKKPVVSTNAGGVKDCMQDGTTGFLVEKNDVITFCEKLSLLINSCDLRISMGKAGRKYAIDAFSKEKEVQATKELYFSLMNKKGLIINKRD